MCARDTRARRIGDALRSGLPVPDRVFDGLLPADLRGHSERYWSPVAVAMLAARWLARDGARVIDVGSGGGKFCTIGALVTGATFVGIEQRPHLVQSARELAERLGVADRVEFVHGGVAELFSRPSGPESDGTDRDALYVYNPFEEAVLKRDQWLDQSIELSAAKFDADVSRMEAAFERLAFGACVVTYEGFGGVFPDGFKLLRSTDLRGGRLCFWRKTRPRRLAAQSMRAP